MCLKEGLPHMVGSPFGSPLLGILLRISYWIHGPSGTLEIWEHGSTIHGHIGIVIYWDKASGEAVEGNTHPDDHKGPHGVWIRYRDIIPSDYFRIRWFTFVRYK